MSGAATTLTRREPRMVTMKDIALKTGVSTATVSRVLNGKDQGRIKPEIAREVRHQAEVLGYTINPIARGLRTNRSHMIGLISDAIATTPYAGRIILGAQDAARAFGYLLTVVNTGDDAELEREQITMMRRYGVDGFLYATMYNQIRTLPDALDGCATVMVDAEDADGQCPSIGPDEWGIGEDATNRLLTAGCTRIAYFGCPPVLIAQPRRLAGYEAALDQAGIAPEHRLALTVDENVNGAQRAATVFDAGADGIFCFNDVRVRFIYEEAERRGLHIGQDVSVVSVDNFELLAGFFEPRLTSIELPHYEMGYWGACKLISMIEGRDLSDALDTVVTDAVMPDLSVDHGHIRCAIIEKESVRQAA